LTRSHYGVTAARWAAAILAFNEYFLSFSSRATANTPYLFLAAAAVYAFARFLVSERPTYLYIGATATGLAFYCKEHAALLVPVALAALFWPQYRPWWRRRAPYVAAAVFALLIAPDVIWNLRTDPTSANVTYRGEYLGQATYSAHLKRIGGLGLSPYPAMFYAREPISRLHSFVTGVTLLEPARDYHSVNPAIGLFLIAAMLWMTVSGYGHAPVRRWLLSVAWAIFLFFTFIRPGNTPYRLTPVSWVWVEVTLLPAVVCGGVLLAHVQGRRRTLLWVFASTALMYAVAALTWPAAV
jgi:4-amino-4-deoxy-L-arabinose transferase-like glycosyltransferase